MTDRQREKKFLTEVESKFLLDFRTDISKTSSDRLDFYLSGPTVRHISICLRKGSWGGSILVSCRMEFWHVPTKKSLSPTSATFVIVCKKWWVPKTSDEVRIHLDKLQVSLGSLVSKCRPSVDTSCHILYVYLLGYGWVSCIGMSTVTFDHKAK